MLRHLTTNATHLATRIRSTVTLKIFLALLSRVVELPGPLEIDLTSDNVGRHGTRSSQLVWSGEPLHGMNLNISIHMGRRVVVPTANPTQFSSRIIDEPHPRLEPVYLLVEISGRSGCNGDLFGIGLAVGRLGLGKRLGGRSDSNAKPPNSSPRFTFSSFSLPTVTLSSVVYDTVNLLSVVRSFFLE